VEGFNGPNTVFDDVRFGIADSIRRQATLAFAQAHTAPGGMKTYAHFLGRPNFIVNFAAVRVQIEVIGHGRAAAQYQFAQANFGAYVDCFRSHLGP